MGGFFTRDERIVVMFVAASVVLGSLVLVARRIDPTLAPELSPPVDAGNVVAAAPSPKLPVDVNRASAVELEALPGIGPARARAIVKLRAERGGFGSVDELVDVSGIGPKTLERLRPLASVSDTTRDDRPPAPGAATDVSRGGEDAR